MANGTQEKVHISATMLIGAFVALLIFIWKAQAEDVDEAATLVTENSKQIAVLINENLQREKDTKRVQIKVDANGRLIARVERTLIKIAAELDVKVEEPTPP